MKNKLYVLIGIILFIVEYIIVCIIQIDDMGTWRGLSFGDEIPAQIFYFIIFFLGCFLISHEMEYYFNQEGIVCLIRNKKRRSLYLKIYRKLAIRLLLYRLLECGIYTFLSVGKFNKIDIPSVMIGFLYNIIASFILMAIQINIEIRASSEHAIWIIGIIYFITTILGTIIHCYIALKIKLFDMINILLIPNYLYLSRVDVMKDTASDMWINLLLLLIFIAVNIYFVYKIRFYEVIQKDE